MSRLAGVELFSPDELAIVHAMNRVVCLSFLLGYDPISVKNFDHRKIFSIPLFVPLIQKPFVKP